MTREDLYDLGVVGFKNAKHILEHAKSYRWRHLPRQSSGSQEERRSPQLVRQECRDYDGQYAVKILNNGHIAGDEHHV